MENRSVACAKGAKLIRVRWVDVMKGEFGDKIKFMDDAQSAMAISLQALESSLNSKKAFSFTMISHIISSGVVISNMPYVFLTFRKMPL